MTDIPRELDDIRSRMRTLEGAYRKADRQSMLQRIGGGATPRELGYDEPRSPRMAMSSGFNTLGNVTPWHGQANILLDPTFETLSGDVPFTTTEGENGFWKAAYVVDSGDAPTAANLTIGFNRVDPDNNPFNTATVELAFEFAAADEGEITIYFYPATDFSPNVIPTLPYLVGAVRLFSAWSYLQTVDSVEASLELVDVSTMTVVAESEARPYPSDELQFQLVVAASYDVGITDWRWRLKLVVVKSASGLDADLNIGIGEPQLNFTYTPDALPFQPVIGNWHQEAVPEVSFGSDIESVGTANVEGIVDTVARSDHVHDASSLSELALTGPLILSNVVSVSLSASQSNYNPTGFSTCNVLRVLPLTTTRDIDGFAAQESGRLILLVYAGTSFSDPILQLQPASVSSSSAANQIITPATSTFQMTVGESCFIWYDGTSSRWRVITAA